MMKVCVGHRCWGDCGVRGCRLGDLRYKSDLKLKPSEQHLGRQRTDRILPANDSPKRPLSFLLQEKVGKEVSPSRHKNFHFFGVKGGVCLL